MKKLLISYIVLLFAFNGYSQGKPERMLNESGGSVKTLKQANKMNPDKVTHLILQGFSDSIFPSEKLLKFKNLKFVRLMARLTKDKFSDTSHKPPLKITINKERLLQFDNLEYLIFHDFDFRSFPNELLELTNLKGLGLPICLIDSLPEEIENLKNLQILDLSLNYLSTLPQSIKDLDFLEVLDLRNNPFTIIPNQIFEMDKLTRLTIANVESGTERVFGWNWPFPIKTTKIDLNQSEWEKIERISKGHNNLTAIISVNKCSEEGFIQKIEQLNNKRITLYKTVDCY